MYSFILFTSLILNLFLYVSSYSKSSYNFPSLVISGPLNSSIISVCSLLCSFCCYLPADAATTTLGIILFVGANNSLCGIGSSDTGSTSSSFAAPTNALDYGALS